MEASHLVGIEPQRAFDELIAMPLSTVFVSRYAAFPVIRDVRDAPEAWDTVGQTRTLLLGDGFTLRETMTSLDRPHSFGYALDQITGPMRPFVRSVQGLWTVVPEGQGSRITWAWDIEPLAPPARLTMSVIGRMWHGYAERALQRIDDILSFSHDSHPESGPDA